MSLELHQLYGIYRDYMKHEDDLLNQRCTWLLFIQGFLFATLGVIGEWPFPKVGQDSLHFMRQWLVFVLAALGILISVAAFITIWAANRAIDKLCSDWTAVLQRHHDEDSRSLPGIAGGGRRHAKMMGKSPTLAIPWLVVVAWIVIATVARKDITAAQSANNAPAASTKAAHRCGQPMGSESIALTRQQLVEELACSSENTYGLTVQLRTQYGMSMPLNAVAKNRSSGLSKQKNTR